MNKTKECHILNSAKESCCVLFVKPKKYFKDQIKLHNRAYQTIHRNYMNEYHIKNELEYHNIHRTKEKPFVIWLPDDFSFEKLNELPEVKEAGIFYMQPYIEIN